MMNTTNKAYANRLVAAARARQITLVTPIESVADSHTRLRFRCDLDGHEWETQACNITRKDGRASGCPECARGKHRAVLFEAGRASFAELLAENGYMARSEYRGHFERMELHCQNPEHESFFVSPGNFKSGQRCPLCSGTHQHTRRADPVKSYIAGTTWKAATTTRKNGAQAVELQCAECNATRALSLAHAIRSHKRPLENRECDCQRFGRPFREYVNNTAEYEMVGKYVKSKVPIRMRHITCKTEWDVTPSNFAKPNYPTRCPKCARTGRASQGQLEVTKFVESLGLRVETDVRRLYPDNPRYEVDIYVPDKRVAIEFDGVWWHAEGSSRNSAGRGRADSLPGEALRRAEILRGEGIRLIRIFSDEWAYRKTAVQSRLQAILARPERRLDARKLHLDTAVPSSEAADFIARSHVQGTVSAASMVAVGLRANDGALEAVMTFGCRSMGGSSAGVRVELLRFCSAPGTQVRGAASRLLSAFARSYELDGADQRIVTYADIRWSGLTATTMYEKIGFTPTGQTRPSYSYVHPSQSNRRISRMQLQRHKLVGMDPSFTTDMTEREMSEYLGYARVWDSGQLRFELDLSKYVRELK